MYPKTCSSLHVESYKRVAYVVVLQGLQQQPSAQRQTSTAQPQPSTSASLRQSSAHPTDPRAAAMKAPSPPPGPPPGNPGGPLGSTGINTGVVRAGTPPVLGQVKQEARVSPTVTAFTVTLTDAGRWK